MTESGLTPKAIKNQIDAFEDPENEQFRPLPSNLPEEMVSFFKKEPKRKRKRKQASNSGMTDE